MGPTQCCWVGPVVTLATAPPATRAPHLQPRVLLATTQDPHPRDLALPVSEVLQEPVLCSSTLRSRFVDKETEVR